MLLEVGRCYVIAVDPSFIYSAKVLERIVPMNMSDEAMMQRLIDPIYVLNVAWIERVMDLREIARSDDPHTARGLRCKAGIIMRVRESRLGGAWEAKAHITRDVDPPGGGWERPVVGS